MPQYRTQKRSTIWVTDDPGNTVEGRTPHSSTGSLVCLVSHQEEEYVELTQLTGLGLSTKDGDRDARRIFERRAQPRKGA